ncbi:hypothetical protein [Carboxylicivirga linearis]|uniref:Lipoprotein n=1 Tax=Carboxylicivirga linearis TaxID=1628157 RepID=A0ABS5K449_9BACT|nr:hypothetical protein [Carboxylicivirga linearis]MBS2101281.1 hypothetical protein [Carboxylicivirga linearis]
MRLSQSIILIILIVLSSCRTSKTVTSYEKVKNGKDLDNVSLISLNDFANLWCYNRRIQKIDLNTREIYKDNQFTYFGNPKLGATKLKWTFFKVCTDTLVERFPNYEEFYGSELYDFMWSEVIPKEDIELWNYNRTIHQNELRPNCPNKKNRAIHKYTLSDTKVILTMTWEIECEELKTLKNKLYKASYDLISKQFEKL